jgi:hypothetical protein
VLSLLFPPHPNYKVHPNYSSYKYTHTHVMSWLWPPTSQETKNQNRRRKKAKAPSVWFLSFFTHQEFKFELWTFIWAIIVIAIPKYNIVQLWVHNDHHFHLHQH